MLVVATGLQLNYNLIEGMSTELIGSHGIFTSPQTAIKCAGAPIKMAFTTLSGIKATGARERFNLDYFTAGGGMFSQPWVSEFLKQRFDREGISWHHLKHLTAIDPKAKQAEFTSKGGDTEVRPDQQNRRQRKISGASAHKCTPAAIVALLAGLSAVWWLPALTHSRVVFVTTVVDWLALIAAAHRSTMWIW